jgi:hypothetical protein
MGNYIGLDYSLGRSNVNPQTGIHFGVISQHSISGDALNDMDPDYGDAHCPKCGNDAVAFDAQNAEHTADDVQDGHGCADYFCTQCKYVFDSAEAFPDEALGFSYDAHGYKLTDCLDSDIMVIDSPYYTFTQYCSPCVPGAGNLDNSSRRRRKNLRARARLVRGWQSTLPRV